MLAVQSAPPHTALHPFIRAYVQREAYLGRLELVEPVVARLGVMLEFEFAGSYEVRNYGSETIEEPNAISVIGPQGWRRSRLIIRYILGRELRCVLDRNVRRSTVRRSRARPCCLAKYCDSETAWNKNHGWGDILSVALAEAEEWTLWSLLKRGISGTYVSVEPFHVLRYLDEQAFRYNQRQNMNDFDRFRSAATQIVGKRLTWDSLTGKQEDARPSVN